MTDYKKYSLGQLENFLYDAMSTDATPQEIYDVIKGVVQDNLEVYTKSADRARELLSLLNGHRPVDLEHSEHYYDYNRNKPELVACDRNNTSEECKKSWNDFWVEPSMPPWGHSDLEYGIHYSDEELDAMCDAAKAKDKVNKWILPVDDDYNITFPEDLLEQTGWKEGDTLLWIDQGDGSFKMIKVTKPIGMEEC